MELPSETVSGVGGHKTSVSLEGEFWSALKEIARDEGLNVFGLATRIDRERTAVSKSKPVVCHPPFCARSLR